MTVNFLYIFQITLYQIRNLIEKKKQSYANKDSSNSGKSIQFDFCTNCILQMLKPISHVKIHRSWSTTCSSLVDFFSKGSRQLLYTTCGEHIPLKAGKFCETRQNERVVNCYTSISNREHCYAKISDCSFQFWFKNA